MQVPPHPHVGLHTVTWLFSGELVHRDSLGNEQLLRPGQVNVMTAGHGISHSEESPANPAAPTLDGFQLWIAQPEQTRHGPSSFAHHESVPTLELGPAARATVFIDGGLPGAPTLDTELSGMELSLSGTAEVPVPLRHEHLLVVADGELLVEGVELASGTSLHLEPGRRSVRLQAAGEARALLLGGPPFSEEVVMSWNFVARTSDELEQARRDWASGSSRFGAVGSRLERVPAPPARRA
jgi:quercetin 2,3-dioxygenase